MSENLNEQVIVAYFANAEQADQAAHALMNWDKASDDIKLGTLGRLVEVEEGKLEAKRYGAGRAGKGAMIERRAGTSGGGLHRWAVPGVRRASRRRSRRAGRQLYGRRPRHDRRLYGKG